MKFYKILLSAAIVSLSATAVFAQDNKNAEPKEAEYEFTVVKENPITSIKNQYRSGTCWCFSALSFVESELMRMGKGEVDLSEMFVVGHSYHDRAVKYVRLDGHLNFAAGSSFGDVFHVIKDYGIVPQADMPGLNYGTELPEHFELDEVLAGYVKAVVQNPNKTLTTAWQNGFDGILKAYLGEYPGQCTVEIKGEKAIFTPQEYRDYLGINVDDYINLTSFTHHPFYQPFIIEVCDNWRWDSAYNLPLDELMQVMYNAINEGYTIAWGSDVSEKGFTRDGIAVLTELHKKASAGSDQERWVGKSESAQKEELKAEKATITQEMRQLGYDNKQTTDDHGMHIFGMAKDQDGNDYFMVKNSWGEAGKYKGIWYASDDFVRYKTLNIVVHKNAIPKDIRKKLGIK